MCALGDFINSKRGLKIADHRRGGDGNKDRNDRHKDSFSCLYRRKWFNIKKKSPNEGLLFYSLSKNNHFAMKVKRQKGHGGCGFNRLPWHGDGRGDRPDAIR